MDANMNALWTNAVGVDPRNAARMTAFWGDESWRSVAYEPDPQGDFFDEQAMRKLPNSAIVAAFRNRLRDVAGFAHVPEPIPMRNKKNAVVYYLFFASQNKVAAKIASWIFERKAAPGGH
jgi:three-Cys-motif partner protein